MLFAPVVLVLNGIARIFGESLTPEAAVERILADVRAHGDEALIYWSKTIDGAGSSDLAVPAAARRAALDQIAPELRVALEKSAERIAGFHRRQTCGLTGWRVLARRGWCGALEPAQAHEGQAPGAARSRSQDVAYDPGRDRQPHGRCYL